MIFNTSGARSKGLGAIGGRRGHAIAKLQRLDNVLQVLIPFVGVKTPSKLRLPRLDRTTVSSNEWAYTLFVHFGAKILTKLVRVFAIFTLLRFEASRSFLKQLLAIVWWAVDWVRLCLVVDLWLVCQLIHFVPLLKNGSIGHVRFPHVNHSLIGKVSILKGSKEIATHLLWRLITPAPLQALNKNSPVKNSKGLTLGNGLDVGKSKFLI